ncbi:general transcription factor IIH subunit 2 [Nematostella vectensis]|uniref:general transcription factor IIH subunit 2 n=1 Tax=Nematostella vectensis TaxID=45351 RepID=UPI0020770A40|nr:general transcription factor IIH subunit 2 [Nematostella vectensis]
MADLGGPDDESGYRWLSQYEKTWEAIREDDEGSLQTLVDELVHRSKRQRVAARPGNVRLGMMRHLYIIIDMSKAMEEADLKPNRLSCSAKLLENFITEYFDQNPISQLGLIITKNKRAEKLSELSGNPKHHISTIQSACSKPCVGEPSLQNALVLAMQSLKHMPGHVSREVLVLMGSLTSCDPGDITETVKSLKNMNVRCSIVGLAAEMRVCKQICSSTNGSYRVVLDERHFKDLLMEHVIPPTATADTEASLIRMGFPQHLAKGPPSLCHCHMDNKNIKEFTTKGYFCPQCRSKYCDLPVECKVCGLTLVSAPHLARSYQHLFPLQQYTEVNVPAQIPGQPPWTCQACQITLTEKTACSCPECRHVFCLDCDIYIHESLHTCPGCTAHQVTVARQQPNS